MPNENEGRPERRLDLTKLPDMLPNDVRTLVVALRAMADGAVLVLPPERRDRVHALADILAESADGHGAAAYGLYHALLVAGPGSEVG